MHVDVSECGAVIWCPCLFTCIYGLGLGFRVRVRVRVIYVYFHTGKGGDEG